MPVKPANQTGRGTVYILAGKTAMILLMLSQAVLIPRVLGPEGMGFYSYWISVFFVLGTLFGLGGPSILARYLPEFRIRDELSIRPLIKKILLIKLPVICGAGLFGQFLFSGQRAYFLIVLVGAVFFSITAIIRTIFYAYQRMDKYALLPFVRMLVKVVLILLLFPLFGDWGILFAVLSGSLVALLVFGYFGVASLPRDFRPLSPPFKKYMAFGLILYLGALLASLNTWLVVILAKTYLPDASLIGYLGFGLQICLFASSLVYSVGDSALPSWVEFHVNKDERLTRSTDLSWKYTNLLLFPIVFGILSVVKPAVALLIGSRFLPGIPVIYLFLPTVIFLSWSHVHEHLLFTFEKKKKLLLVQLIRFVVFIISGCYLIRKMSIEGAAISVGLGALAGYLYSGVTSSKLSRIPRYFLSVVKPLLAAAFMSIVLSFIEVTQMITLIGVIVLAPALYLGGLWFIKGISRSDIERVRGVLFRGRVAG